MLYVKTVLIDSSVLIVWLSSAKKSMVRLPPVSRSCIRTSVRARIGPPPHRRIAGKVRKSSAKKTFNLFSEHAGYDAWPVMVAYA